MSRWGRGWMEWVDLVALGAMASVLALAAPADARKIWTHGDAHLAFSGSGRELAQFGNQTDADAFQAAIVQDLTSLNTRCLQAAGFAD